VASRRIAWCCCSRLHTGRKFRVRDVKFISQNLENEGILLSYHMPKTELGEACVEPAGPAPILIVLRGSRCGARATHSRVMELSCGKSGLSTFTTASFNHHNTTIFLPRIFAHGHLLAARTHGLTACYS